MISISVTGSTKNIEAFTQRIKRGEQLRSLGPKWGPVGVNALAAATPVDTAETQKGWYFQVMEKPGQYSIHWLNSKMHGMIPVAALIQYGHGTRQGGYVQGIDYINPALRPVFRQITEDMWKAVIK